MAKKKNTDPLSLEDIQKAATDYFSKAYAKEPRSVNVQTNAEGEKLINEAIQKEFEKKIEKSAGRRSWELYEQTKKEKSPEPTELKIESPNKRDYTVYLDTADKYMWNPPTPYEETTIRINQKEYDELKANQKPKEWSDDIVLIDINKLVAYLLARENKIGWSPDEWYGHHKENDLLDKEFELWDEMYNLILKFRSNEQ